MHYVFINYQCHSPSIEDNTEISYQKSDAFESAEEIASVAAYQRSLLTGSWSKGALLTNSQVKSKTTDFF